jgi:hypothetical protein
MGIPHVHAPHQRQWLFRRGFWERSQMFWQCRFVDNRIGARRPSDDVRDERKAQTEVGAAGVLDLPTEFVPEPVIIVAALVCGPGKGGTCAGRRSLRPKFCVVERSPARAA